MNNVFVFTIVSFLLTSCMFIPTKLNNKVLKNENNFKIKSKSDYFHIYKTHREFVFRVHQIINNDTIDYYVNAKIIPIKSSNLALVKYTYHYSKHLISKFNLDVNCVEENIDCFNEVSTIKEIQNWVWMHPPRAYTLRILELAPFPEVYFDRKNWGGTLSIPKGNWGEWENSSFKWEYKIDSVLNNKYRDQNYTYINSTSTSKFGLNSNKIVFQRDSGFVEMNYTFENEDKVLIKLESINEN